MSVEPPMREVTPTHARPQTNGKNAPAPPRIPSPKEEPLFDLRPAHFPFNDATCATLLKRRTQLQGQLFFDIILESAGVDIESQSHLYPPRNPDAFEELVETYTHSTDDSLRRLCLTYFLLRWWSEAKAVDYRKKVAIPGQFALVTDAYFYLDQGDLRRGTALLCDARIPSNNSSKIMFALSFGGEPKDILRYVRANNPVLTEQWELDLHISALAKTSLRMAWTHQRSFGDYQVRRQLLLKILETCLIPTPSSQRLQSLLAFPYDTFEQDTLHDFALHPPELFLTSEQALPVLHDLLVTRLITLGQYALAAKLNAELPPPRGEEAKKRALARQETVEEVLNGLSKLVRAEVEKEVKGNDVESSSKPFPTPLATPISMSPAPGTPTLSASISSRAGTPRKSKPIQPLFSTSISNTPPQPFSVAPVPATASSSLARSQPPSFDNSRVADNRFVTPPRIPAFPEGPLQYIRSQGAPSPATPLPTKPRKSVQKTKNAFYDPGAVNGPKPSLFGDADGGDRRRSFGLSSGPLLRVPSGLSNVVSAGDQRSEEGGEAEGEGGEGDMDNFVRRGGRRSYPLLLPSREREEEIGDDETNGTPDMEVIDGDGDIGIKIGPPDEEEEEDRHPPRSTRTRATTRKGMKRVASTQLVPGSFPSEAEEGPGGGEEESRGRGRRTTTTTSSKRSRGERSTSTRASSTASGPQFPGAFDEGPEPEGEEQDSLAPLPQNTSTKAGGRRRRGQSVDSDVSMGSASGVRRSTRLASVGAGSDTETDGGGGGGGRGGRRGGRGRGARGGRGGRRGGGK